MIRVIFFIYLVIVSYNASACLLPVMSQEIDSLVQAEHLGGNKFKVIAPQQVKILNYGAEFTLMYYKTYGSNKIKYAKQEIKLETNKKGENLEAIFEVDPIKGFTPFVLVYWHPEYCCYCGAVGRSKDLVF